MQSWVYKHAYYCKVQSDSCKIQMMPARYGQPCINNQLYSNKDEFLKMLIYKIAVPLCLCAKPLQPLHKIEVHGPGNSKTQPPIERYGPLIIFPYM